MEYLPHQGRRALDDEVLLLLERYERIDEHLRATDAAIEVLKNERTHALTYGLTTLGFGIAGLLKVIWDLTLGTHR